MAEVLGIGVSHYPPFSGLDKDMSLIVRNRMLDPNLPETWKDPSNWPDEMQREWANDEGTASAAQHREQILLGMRKCMQAINQFKPDFCIIWGDDQYENFKEDIIPPFSVLAYDDMQVKPWAQAAESAEMGKGRPNIWNESADTKFDIKFAKQVAKEMTSYLIQQDFDVSYAYKPNNHPGLPHAFLNAILYLDYDRQGFDYPIIPLPINCYGDKVISYRGYVSPLGDDRELDPPAPSPSRCFDLGAKVADFCRLSPYRIALIASSSWSHAFLCDKHFRMMPDVDFDKRMYSKLINRDFEGWRSCKLKELTDSGNQELLNWMAFIGAMSNLDLPLKWSDFVETRLFNSNKVAAIFKR